MDFEIFRNLVQQALAEDVGEGDLTTEALIPPEEIARARIVAREDLVTAGLPLVEMVFSELDENVVTSARVKEGELVPTGTVLMTLEGPARAILTGERVALNFLQQLSGIATLTSRFRKEARRAPVIILDTRKTLPGWRKLQRYAVLMGGGTNHRSGLYDAILIKDNHLAIVARQGPGKIARAVKLCREKYPELPVEVEVEDFPELEEAWQAGAETILLDNFSPDDLAEAVKLNRGRARLEASGGINLKTIAAVAQTGVDSVSIGALTHSAPAVDIALDLAD